MKVKGVGKFVFGLFVSTLIVGCVTTGKDGHSYVNGNCVTCINNPITGEAINYSKKTPDYKQAEESRRIRDGHLTEQEVSNMPYLEGLTSFSKAIDVDTAYTLIKREFKFITQYEWENTYLYQDEGFVYEALPGVSYHMRFSVPHRFKGVKRDHYIEAILNKNGGNTDITFKFWVKVSRSSMNQYAGSIKQRAIRALR
jgi:hypothetical protein